MSHAVKEPTFILGYTRHPTLIGILEISRSNNKNRIEKMLEQYQNMSVKKKMKEFDCTEIQAGYLTFKLVSIYPKVKDVTEVDEDITVDDQDEPIIEATSDPSEGEIKIPKGVLP